MHNEGGADAHESVDFTEGPHGRRSGRAPGRRRARPRARRGAGRRHRRLRRLRRRQQQREPERRAAPSSRAASSRSASQPGNVNFDPALFAGAVSDILLQQQIYEKLVTLGQDFTVQPTLATKWDSPDGKVWTFTLAERRQVQQRPGLHLGRRRLHDGPAAQQEARLADGRRLRQHQEESSAPDPTTVVFTLSTVDSEFPASLTDYRTLMLCKSVKDPAKEAVGTGPFVLESISAEDRAVLKKNADLLGHRRRRQQAPVPRRDRLHLLAGHRRSDLRPAGRLAQLGRRPLRPSRSCRSRRSPDAQDRSTTNTNYCFELQIRTDQKPGQRPRVPPGDHGRHRPPGHRRPRRAGRRGPRQRHARRPRLRGRLPRRRRCRTTRRRPSSCSPTPATPTA